MDTFHIMQVVERLARQQRLATLAAGIKAAHPAMYPGDVVYQALTMEESLQELDAKRNPHSGY